MQRLSFFDTAQYNLGGLSLSLNQIENGILRQNQVPPAHLRRPFPKGHVGRALVLTNDGDAVIIYASPRCALYRKSLRATVDDTRE